MGERPRIFLGSDDPHTRFDRRDDLRDRRYGDVAGRLGESPRHERGNDVGTNGSSYDSTDNASCDDATAGGAPRDGDVYRHVRAGQSRPGRCWIAGHGDEQEKGPGGRQATVISRCRVAVIDDGDSICTIRRRLMPATSPDHPNGHSSPFPSNRL